MSPIESLPEALNVDKNLNLSCKNLVDELRQKIKIHNMSPIEKRLMTTREFPSAAVLSLFSLKVYENLDKEYENFDGWELLTTAANVEIVNGYFAAAFFHPEQHRIIIAHRGTELNNIGSVVADIAGIVGNKCGGQMESACTFSERITQSLRMIEDENEGVHFEIFFTGHSLGAWLAQVTSFSNEFLKAQNDSFVCRIETDSEPYHAHTIVFDSPGCLPMLSKLQQRYNLKLNDLNYLNITSYLSSPNLINICNEHFGKVYRIFIDTSKINALNKALLATGPLGYTIVMHSIDNMAKAFEENIFMVHEVIEWPTREGLSNTQEFEKFLKYADHRYHIRECEKKIEIRYRTIDFDESSAPINIFTVREKKFLEYFRWIRQLPEFEKIKKLIQQIRNDIVGSLSLFEIVDDNLHVKNPVKLRQFIPHVKLLLKLFPKIAEILHTFIIDSKVREKILTLESQFCLDKIKENFLDFKSSTVDWSKILEYQIVQLNVTAGKAQMGLSMIYSTYVKSPYKFKEASVFVFDIQRFLIVNDLVDFRSLQSTNESNSLLILYSEGDLDKANNLSFENFLKALREHQHLKVVLIGKSDDRILEAIKSQAITKLENHFYEFEKCFSWNNLTEESQKKLLNRSIKFQGRNENLNNLISSNICVDDKVFLQLLNNENLSINDDPLASCGFSFTEIIHDKKTIKSSVIFESLENSEDIFVISGLYDEGRENILKGLTEILLPEDEKQKNLIHENLVANDKSVEVGKLHIISRVGSEKCLQDFDSKCREFQLKNINQTIHWIKISEKKITWRKSFCIGSVIQRRVNEDMSNQKIVAILGRKGDGKTTFLTKFAQDKLKKYWMIYLNFKDLPLSSLNCKDLSNEVFANFVMKAAHLDEKNYLQSFALRHKILNSSPNPIHFCFDGFDEIVNEEDQVKAIKLLNYIKNTECFATLTSCESARNSLMIDLQPFYCTLEKMSREEKETILKDYWRSRFVLTLGHKKCCEIFSDDVNSKFKRFTKMLFYQLDTLMEKKSVGIPQLLQWLAEGFQEDFDVLAQASSKKQKFLSDSGLSSLYEKCIKIKFDHVVAVKIKAAEKKQLFEHTSQLRTYSLG